MRQTDKIEDGPNQELNLPRELYLLNHVPVHVAPTMLSRCLMSVTDNTRVLE